MNNSFFTFERKKPVDIIIKKYKKSCQIAPNRQTTLKTPNTISSNHIYRSETNTFYKLMLYCAVCGEELENRHQKLVGYHGRCYNK